MRLTVAKNLGVWKEKNFRESVGLCKLLRLTCQWMLQCCIGIIANVALKRTFDLTVARQIECRIAFKRYISEDFHGNSMAYHRFLLAGKSILHLNCCFFFYCSETRLVDIMEKVCSSSEVIINSKRIWWIWFIFIYIIKWSEKAECILISQFLVPYYGRRTWRRCWNVVV